MTEAVLLKKDRALDLARRLVSTLPVGVPGLFNPWADSCAMDQLWNGAHSKLQRLAEHLDCDAKIILCGEAPGYAGARHTGIAFTSERLICEGKIPRVVHDGRRLTLRAKPFSEQSATIVWDMLNRLGIAERTIMWNAVQLHPHLPSKAHSNRTPAPSEVVMGIPALKLLLDSFPSARLLAIGRTSERLLGKMGFDVDASIRHPANGGAKLFRDGVAAAVARL